MCVNGMAKADLDLADTGQLIQGEAVWVFELQLLEDLDLAMATTNAGVQFDTDQLGVPDLAQTGSNLVWFISPAYLAEFVSGSEDVPHVLCTGGRARCQH